MNTQKHKPQLSIQISARSNFGSNTHNNTASPCPFMTSQRRGSTDSCCTFWYSREEPEHVTKIFQIYNNKLGLNKHLQPNSREPKRFIGKIKRYPLNTNPHFFETIDELVINRRDLLPLGRMMPTIKKCYCKTRWSADGLPSTIEYISQDSDFLYSVKLREKCLNVSYIFCLPLFSAHDKFEYFSGKEDRRIGYAEYKQSSFVLKKPKVNYCDPQSPPISPRKNREIIWPNKKQKDDDDDDTISRVDSNDKIETKESYKKEEEEEDDEEEEEEEDDSDDEEEDDDDDDDSEEDDEEIEEIEYDEFLLVEEDDDDDIFLCDQMESLSVSQNNQCDLHYILTYNFTLNKCDDGFGL